MFPISYGRGIPPPSCGSRVVSLPLVLVIRLLVIRLLLLLLLLSCSLLLPVVLPVLLVLPVVLGGMYVICFDLYPFVLDV